MYESTQERDKDFKKATKLSKAEASEKAFIKSQTITKKKKEEVAKKMPSYLSERKLKRAHKSNFVDKDNY